jgi:hypothetical protein
LQHVRLESHLPLVALRDAVDADEQTRIHTDFRRMQLVDQQIRKGHRQ